MGTTDDRQDSLSETRIQNGLRVPASCILDANLGRFRKVPPNVFRKPDLSGHSSLPALRGTARSDRSRSYAAENAALARCARWLLATLQPRGFFASHQFLEAHPKSCWNAALLANLGLEYYRTGRYSKTPEVLATGLGTWEGRHGP